MILAACFILLVVVLAWFALDRVKEKIQADVGDSLLWVESNKSQLTRLAEDPRLVSLTEQQLLVPRNKISLFENKILMELRAFFRRHRDREGLAGFFIIAPDFTNIVTSAAKTLSPIRHWIFSTEHLRVRRLWFRQFGRMSFWPHLPVIRWVPFRPCSSWHR
jgi:hypothetical protein